MHRTIWPVKIRYEVTPVLKGLGEYPKIRQILVDHVQQAMDASI